MEEEITAGLGPTEKKKVDPIDDMDWEEVQDKKKKVKQDAIDEMLSDN